MNQYELKIQNRRLMESQEKFVNAVCMLVDVVERLSARLAATDKYLDASCDAHAAREASMGAQENLLNGILEALITIQNTFVASNATINENSARLEKLLSKFEAYFASTNLDYDN